MDKMNRFDDGTCITPAELAEIFHAEALHIENTDYHPLIQNTMNGISTTLRNLGDRMEKLYTE